MPASIALPRGLVDPLKAWVAREPVLAVGRILLGAYGLGCFAFFLIAGPTVTTRAVLRNALESGELRVLAAVIVASLATALAWIFVSARRDAADPVGGVVASSYLPFLFAPFVVWPLYEAATDIQVQLLAIAVMAGGFAFALQLFGTRARWGHVLDATDPLRLTRVGWVLALVMGLGHAYLLARASLANFDSVFNGWDLAIYSQVHWNITTTGIPWSTTYSDATWNHYAIHFSPIYHLTSLLYRLHRSPATLLVIENVAIGLGALPLYGLARRLTGKPSIGLLLVASYLCNPCTLSLGLYDFHEIVFFVPLMLALAWTVEAERTRLLWVFVVLTLMIREDTPAYLVVYAFYLWLTDRKALGVRIGAIATVYLLLVHGVAMPALRGANGYVFDDRYAGLFRPGTTGKGSVLTTLLTNPNYTVGYVVGIARKWEFVALVLLPALALPLYSRKAVVLLVPGFAFSLLSAFAAQYSIDFHYTSPILPFLYLATILAMVRFEPRTRVALAAGVLLATCLLSAKRGRSPLLNAELVDAEAAIKANVYGDAGHKMHAAAATIPRDACVRATGNLLPTVVERRRAYIVPFGRDCEYAFIDYRRDARNGPSSYEQERSYLLERLRGHDYGVVYGDDRVLLIGKGAKIDRNAEFVARLEAMPER